MEKFCRKGHLKRSGKRCLAILLSVCLIGTMLPITARAEESSTETGLCEHHTEHTSECGYVASARGRECEHVHDDSCGYQEACACNHVHTEVCGENGESCTHVHTSECGYAEGHACEHVHDEECGYVEASEGSPCTFVCDSCGKEAEPGENSLPDETLTQTPEQAEDKLITAWQWIDEEEILDEETGNLALPGASEEMPAHFEDVTAFLPTQIQATVGNAEDSENPETGVEKNITLGDWSCDNYPEEGAYSGSYIFTATLPEGYELSEEAEALTITVELGGAQMYANAESETTGAFTVTGGTLGTDYTYADGVLTIKSATPITIANTDPTTATTDRIEVAMGVSANITLAGVNIDVSSLSSTAAFKIAENSRRNVTITLADDSNNKLKSGFSRAGLQINDTSGKLIIQCESSGTEEHSCDANCGKLTATGGNTGAGIGGGTGNNGSNITISGGTVTATGGSNGAGIGGGDQGSGSNITISGGTVTATGGRYGAGIGGGQRGSGSNITISGGTVTATGGSSGAGIGGGWRGSGSNITISGGTVTAAGGYNGAGIGGGYNGSGSDIKISGGSVKAVAGSDANDIGGGEGGNDAVTPTNGTNSVYLLTIANPDSAEVLIDGVSYKPVNHKAADSNDGNLYAYLTGKAHEVKVGGKTCIYMFDSNTSIFAEAPLTVYATDSAKRLVIGTDYTYENNVLTIQTDTTITIRNTDPSTETTDRIEVASGVSANITLAGVNIDVSGLDNTAAFKIADDSTGNVTITLADGSVNTLKSGTNCAGLQKNGGTSTGTLTIQGGTNGTGKLAATGGESGAGIGGGGGGSGSNIEISGGTVTATSKGDGAGIGGGEYRSGSDITISGGTVTATGGEYGAGIGGGEFGSGSDITISGGTVTATGGYNGAGIGGGAGGDGSGSDITISGGTVTATGGEKGAGIGGGWNSSGSNITISGGSVKAVAGSDANDIGGGNGYDAVTPTSNGTTSVYLLTIVNPDSEEVLIDGVSYKPVNHKATDSNDGNLYAYLTGKTHEVKVGGKTCIYTFDSNTSIFAEAPLTVYATDSAKRLVIGTDYTYADGVLTIKSATPITIANTDPTTATTDRIEVAMGVFANITLAGVNIGVSSSSSTAAFKIADDSYGDVTITLADDSENTLKSGFNCAGLQKDGGEYAGKLTIQGGTNGTGKLTAIGGEEGAGIGGGKVADGSNITIKGGEVTATGGFGAGIGGGGGADPGDEGGDGSNIEISGGTVTAATGGMNGAGIGGGGASSNVDGGSGSDIEISGGTVTATGGVNGAGIGGGCGGSGSIIEISGGTVTATGGVTGAGIGGGCGGSGSNIEISGGTVTATGGVVGAGIGGGGCGGSGSDIEISGGTVTATGGFGAGIGGGGGAAPGDEGGDGSNIEISGGTVTAASKGEGAGIGGGGVGGSGSYITISGGSVNASSIGDTPTLADGITPVYLFEIANIDGAGITINNKAYPDKHTYYDFSSSQYVTEKKIYAYLPAKTVTDPNVVKVGTKETKYIYDNSKWFIVSTVTAPTPNKLVYTGKAQALVTAGTTSGGTMVYSLTESGEYSEDIPTGKDAGTYTVWYKVDGGDDYVDTEPASVEVTIAKALSVITNADTVRNQNTVFGKGDFVAPTAAVEGTVTYKVGETTYTGDELKTYLAGESVSDSPVAVEYTFTPTGTTNYKEVTGTITFTIEAAPMSDIAPDIAVTTYSGSYDGAGHPVVGTDDITGLVGPDNMICYSTDDKATWSTTVPTIKDAGTLELYVKVTKPNYVDWISEKLTATVARKTVTVTAENKTKTYGQENPAFTFTVPEGALAGSDTDEALAVKLSCEATASSPVTTEGYAITGTSSSANYEVTVIPGTLTITRAAAAITVGTEVYDKTLGDEAFQLDVTDTNTEADVQYRVTDSKDERGKTVADDAVVTVNENGTATIHGAGTATIVLSLPESTNYYAAKEKTVSIRVTDMLDGLWMEEIGDQSYNGKAIKPEVAVYYGRELLTVGKDYTISYKNNTNAASADAVNAQGKSIAPTVTIKGKGNFSGTVTKTFTIQPINLDHYETDAQLQELLTIEPVYAKHSGNVIKAAPIVKLNGKKLALSAKQYTCEYNDENPSAEQTAYQDCGTYNITIVGSGRNFVGRTKVTETISGKLITKATIILDRSAYPYHKETGETFPASVTVKDGRETLTEGTDYTVSYKNYDKVGTATVIITGINTYSGVKTKDYKITGTKLTAGMIRQLNTSFVYDGTEHAVVKDTDYTITNGADPLTEGRDYTVTYTGNRTNAGTFKVTFTGTGSYSGTVTKSFTIQKASAKTFVVTLPNSDQVGYAKGGARPQPQVRFHGALLTEGSDYTVTYGNNTKAASAEDKKAPYLFITGKGNFTDNTKATPVKFTIEAAPLDVQTIVVDNVPYKNRNNNYVPTVTITDSTTGRKLAKNTDYLGSFTYEIWDTAANAFVSFDGKKVDASKDNVRMRVTISATGNYSGQTSVEYEICPKSITSAKVKKLPNQEYTGQAITPKPTITDGGKELTEGTDYTLEYSNNTEKGTATVTIRGKGQYGGSRTVKFKITSRIFKWFR